MATRDSATTQDEGFREIQLTGKQLVFLFMATTVVSIVIFLCGVLVGRGVRGNAVVADRGMSMVAPAEPPAGEPDPIDETGSVDDLKTPTQLPRELTYQQRLDGGSTESAGKTATRATAAPPPAAAKAPEGTRTPASASASGSATNSATAESAKAPASSPAVAPSPPATAAAAVTPTEPAPSAAPVAPPASASAFAVQVAALVDRRDADEMLRELRSKGYAAFVLEPAADDKDKYYRVRVGRFADRSDAERTLKRLAAEGPYKPWITR